MRVVAALLCTVVASWFLAAQPVRPVAAPPEALFCFCARGKPCRCGTAGLGVCRCRNCKCSKCPGSRPPTRRAPSFVSPNGHPSFVSPKGHPSANWRSREASRGSTAAPSGTLWSSGSSTMGPAHSGPGEAVGPAHSGRDKDGCCCEKPACGLSAAARAGLASTLCVTVTRPGDWGPRTSYASALVTCRCGWAVTANHVVKGATRVRVGVGDARRDCKVVKCWEKFDLALLRLKKPAEGRRPPALAKALPEPGDLVVVAGNAYGGGLSLHMGMVSATDREIDVPGVGELELIQHSAGVNPGCSGGPLLNVAGEVVGINVAMRDPGQGIGYALPIGEVQRLVQAWEKARKK